MLNLKIPKCLMNFVNRHTCILEKRGFETRLDFSNNTLTVFKTKVIKSIVAEEEHEKLAHNEVVHIEFIFNQRILDKTRYSKSGVPKQPNYINISREEFETYKEHPDVSNMLYNSYEGREICEGLRNGDFSLSYKGIKLIVE